MQIVRNKVREGNKAQATATPVTSCDESEVFTLIKRAADGDFEAFGGLYSIYLERIYRYVFYQVKDKMAAEDITEEVFVKAWRAMGSCKGKEATFSAWLYRIAHNQVIDAFRSKREHLSIDSDNIAEIRDPEPGAAAELEWQELLEVMACLPQNQRQVIILKFIEGLDNREVGQVMGKSEGAIRVLQMRALATLRQKLSSEKE